MTRFEIQDLASQNQDGVTFRALDKSTNKIVSLRRFFLSAKTKKVARVWILKRAKLFQALARNYRESNIPRSEKPSMAILTL